MANSTAQTFTLQNITNYPIDISYVSFVDNPVVQHTADFSSIGGQAVDTRSNTLEQFTKRYQTGDYLEKTYQSDTADISRNYISNTGTRLVVSSTAGIRANWTASGNGYNGSQYVVSVTSATWLLMSGGPTSAPTPGVPIVFHTNIYEIVMDNTSGLSASWSIFGNGYNVPGRILNVVNGTTLLVDFLPTNPQVGNTMLFTSSTNYLTLNSTNNLDVGFAADGNGYDGSQLIINVVDGNIVQMSGQPSSTPAFNDQITFTSNKSLGTINAGDQIAISINYSSSGPSGSNYYSTATIHAIYQNGFHVPILGYIRNYITVNNPPPPPPEYTNNYSGGGGGNRGGGNQQGGGWYGFWSGVTTADGGLISAGGEYSGNPDSGNGDPNGGDANGVGGDGGGSGSA